MILTPVKFEAVFSSVTAFGAAFICFNDVSYYIVIYADVNNTSDDFISFD